VRQVRPVKKLCNFVTGNMQMLVLIYAIMAVAVFVAVNIFFWKISFDLDKKYLEDYAVQLRECHSMSLKMKKSL